MNINLHNINIPVSSLFRSCIVTGQSGSGKSRSILRPTIRQLIEMNPTDKNNTCGLLCVDPKGDMIDWLSSALATAGRHQDLVIMEPGKTYYNILNNPFMNASQIAELLINCANQFTRAKNNSFGPDGKYWELANRNWLTTIVEVLMARRGTALTLNELIRTKTEMSKLTTREVAKQWLTKNQALNLTEETRAAILEMSVLAENTRSCIFTSATQTIIFWGRPPLSELVNPQPNLPEVDLFSILEDGACVVVSVAQPSWGSIMTPLVAALKNHFAQVVLSRPKIEVVENGKARKINQTRPVYLVVDEFHRYISASPDTGEVALLDMAREFRMGAILATQNLSSLQSVVGQTAADLLIALCGTQVFLSNTDYRTATHASRILGTRKIRHEQRSVAPTLPPPLLIKESTRRNGDRSETDSRTSYYTEEPAMTSARLSKLKTGEFWVRLADGTVQHAQAQDYEQ